VEIIGVGGFETVRLNTAGAPMPVEVEAGVNRIGKVPVLVGVPEILRRAVL
jgi:hypothetical protein